MTAFTFCVNSPVNPFTTCINQPVNPFTTRINQPVNPFTTCVNQLNSRGESSRLRVFGLVTPPPSQTRQPITQYTRKIDDLGRIRTQGILASNRNDARENVYEAEQTLPQVRRDDKKMEQCTSQALEALIISRPALPPGKFSKRETDEKHENLKKVGKKADEERLTEGDEERSFTMEMDVEQRIEARR